MADWIWFAGEPKGLCPQCSAALFRAEILVEWRDRVYHVHCLFDLLTALAPPAASSRYYQIPGAARSAP